MLPICASPFLTRLYTPDDFGVLGLYLMILSITSVVAAGRYELALMLPQKDEDAVNVVVLCFFISGFFSLFLVFVAILLADCVAVWLNCPSMKFWIYFVPISTFLTSIFNVLTSLNARFNMYKAISKATIYRTFIAVILQVLFGAFKIGSAGLILGNLFSHFFSNKILCKNFKSKKEILRKIRLTDVKQVFFRYIDFPRYSILEALLNLASRNALTILITVHFSVTILGLYTLVQRVLMLPTILIGDSIGKVFFQEASVEKAASGSINNTFKKTLNKLFLIILPVSVICYFFVEDIFVLFFGKSWRVAGQYAQASLPLIIVQFITSPLAYVWSLFERLKEAMWSQVIFFLFSLLAFIVLTKKNLDFLSILKYYSAIMSVYYLGLLFVFWIMINRKTPLTTSA